MIKANKVCCFTGHRPKGLPWTNKKTNEVCENFKKLLKNTIEKLIMCGYSHFISGMAQGIDMICAEIVLILKQKYSHIILECAIPCIDQSTKWSIPQKNRYVCILNEADIIHNVSLEKYSKNCMNDRNLYMVNKADLVIAVWNGKPSGTLNTIKMAKSVKKDLIIFKYLI